MSEQTSTVTLEQDVPVKAPARGRWRALTRFFRRPTLRVVDHGERHASWEELFFDLVFVVAVAALGHLLHEDTTARGFLVFAGLFVPVWWSWGGFSYYADQFDSDEMGLRLVMAGAMLGIILLAINIEAAAHGEATGFVLAYVLLRVLLIGLYAWARATVPAVRSLCTYFVVGFGLGALLWLLSLLFDPPAQYGVWAVALLVEITTPVIAHMAPTVAQWQSSHMPERFGLFTLIVLGEAVVAVANGVAEVTWGWASVLTGLGGFLIAVAICWLYFGYADETVIDRALRGSWVAMVRAFIYGYSHLLIFASIVATSVGIGLAIEEAHEPALHTGTRAALLGGVIVVLAGMTLSQWAMPYGVRFSILLFRLGLIGLFLALALMGRALPPVVLVSALAIGLIGLIVFEIKVYGEEEEAASA